MKNRFVWSGMMSALIAVVWVTVLTIAGEVYTVYNDGGALVHPLKDLLKSLHGHHWVGKGIWSIMVFCVCLLILMTTGERDSTSVTRVTRSLAYTMVFMTIVLYAFFAYEFFIH